jgi:hypothetical protein
MPEDTIADVAERLDRCADRFRNAGDQESEKAAHEAAAAVRGCGSLEVALNIERAFLMACGIVDKPAIPPAKPRVGTQGPDGKPFVSYGAQHLRSGGSRGWRNNNPGYVPCSDRAEYYGAIGCDGYYAIFPDEDTGRSAFGHWVQEEHAGSAIRDALKAMLPADEAGPDAADRIERQSGVDGDTKGEDLEDEQIDSILDALAAGAVAGESYDINEGLAPEWVESIWEEEEGPHEDAGESGSAVAAATEDAEESAPSDDS